MQDINVILFDNFTLLDAIGPMEVFQKLERFYQINLFSEFGGQVKTNPDLGITTKSFAEIQNFDILLIPGGFGTRKLVDNSEYIAKIKEISEKSKVVLTVCTGSGVLAKTGLLSSKNATSNKMAFDWAKEQDLTVNWIRKARWVVDGKYYTSSGVSAGIDMAFGFISDHFPKDVVNAISKGMEYKWNANKEEDYFA